MMLDEDNLHALKEALDRFDAISGLKCNCDKTMIMPIGTKGPLPLDMHGTLFLGLEIPNDLCINVISI
jgi:hypothetical protein